jgi:hypothetical protein
LLHFYRLTDKSFEYCYNIETSCVLDESDIKTLQWLLSETFEPGNFNVKSLLNTKVFQKNSRILRLHFQQMQWQSVMRAALAV